jgi:hypothetical protein
MSRRTVTLPPPPAKRLKHLQPMPVRQQEAAAETGTPPELHHPIVAAEAEAPEPTLPSDTLVALQLLKSRFPAQVRRRVCMGGRRRSRLPPASAACRPAALPTDLPCAPIATLFAGQGGAVCHAVSAVQRAG